MELGPMGPIGESGSLLLRINRNCPWNRCLFCPVYKGRTFSQRPAEEICVDIDAASRIWSVLDEASWSMGFGGRISSEVVGRVILEHPDLYGHGAHKVAQGHSEALHALNNVANWIHHGVRRVFLQDADALAMKPAALAEVLRYLRRRFPTIETVTAYARSRTCSKRTFRDLAVLHESGLDLCLVGIESGSDAVLEFMHKGVTASQHVDAVTKLREAGIRVAAFVMPGLGGRNREFGDHMKRTIRVLNAGRPHEVRVRSLAVIEGTPLHSCMESGGYMPPTEEQMVDEIDCLIAGIDFGCELETLQMTNPLLTFRGNLDDHRDALRAAIARFKTMAAHEKARILLDRCVEGGYLDVLEARGCHDERIEPAVIEARRSIDKASPGVLDKVDEALRLIKSKGIP